MSSSLQAMHLWDVAPTQAWHRSPTEQEIACHTGRVVLVIVLQHHSQSKYEGHGPLDCVSGRLLGCCCNASLVEAHPRYSMAAVSHFLSEQVLPSPSPEHLQACSTPRLVWPQ